MQIKKRESTEKNRDFASPWDLHEFEGFVDRLLKKYPREELIRRIGKGDVIPVSIFNKRLSPLETVVKYLKEEMGYGFQKISKLLNRSPKTVWQAYNFSKKKFKERLTVEFSDYDIEISTLSNRKFSILESVVMFLKDKKDLSFHKIALMLSRDDRTIWTVYSRAKKKR